VTLWCFDNLNYEDGVSLIFAAQAIQGALELKAQFSRKEQNLEQTLSRLKGLEQRSRCFKVQLLQFQRDVLLRKAPSSYPQ